MSSFKRQLVFAGLLISLCATPLASVTAFADTAVTETSAAATTETAQAFTIDKAIEYAKANSSTLAAAKATELQNQYLASEARITQKTTKKSVNKFNEAAGYAPGIGNINTSLIVNGFMYRSAKMAHRVAQRTTIQEEYKLECNVSQAFYGYLNFLNKEQYAQEALKLAQDNASYAQIRYSGGMLSENDLLNFQIAELSAQNSLNQAVRNREYSMMNLKTVLNYPLEKELVVTGTFTRHEKSAVTPEQALEKSKNSVARANVEDAYALAKEKLERYHGYYANTQAAWHSASAEFANAELTYKDSLNKLTLGIYDAYNSMLTAYEGLDVLDKTLEYSEKQIKAAKISYDSGTMTSGDYISATQAYNQTKNSVADAELGAYIATVGYELTFDCVNTIFEEDDPLL